MPWRICVCEHLNTKIRCRHILNVVSRSHEMVLWFGQFHTSPTNPAPSHYLKFKLMLDVCPLASHPYHNFCFYMIAHVRAIFVGLFLLSLDLLVFHFRGFAFCISDELASCCSKFRSCSKFHSCCSSCRSLCSNCWAFVWKCSQLVFEVLGVCLSKSAANLWACVCVRSNTSWCCLTSFVCEYVSFFVVFFDVSKCVWIVRCSLWHFCCMFKTTNVT